MQQEKEQNIEQRPFLHRELVQFFHVNQKVYLTDTNIDSKTGIHLSGQAISNPNTLFFLEKYSPPYGHIKSPLQNNSKIIQGDLLRIKGFASNYYLTCVPDGKSVITKQGLIELQKLNEAKYTGGEQVFLIQDTNTNSQKIRLINTETGMALHSHLNELKEYKNQKEITGFKGRDDNDYWIVQFASMEMKENIKQNVIPEMVPRKYQSVRPQDKVVMRNAFTGGALHSHNVKYGYGEKLQEVTWKIQPRDKNDWWVLQKNSEPNKNDSDVSKVKTNSIVSFIHVETKLALTHKSGQNVKTGDFRQISCAKSFNPEFKLQLVDLEDEQDYLVTDKPFRIVHIPTQLYVAALERPSSATTFQGEIVLTPTYDWRAVWVVEMVDSIYA